MANSDMHGFPRSGMPVLKNESDAIALGTLYDRPLKPANFIIDTVGNSRLLGAMTIGGALTGVTSVTMAGAITGATTIAHSGAVTGTVPTLYVPTDGYVLTGSTATGVTSTLVPLGLSPRIRQAASAWDVDSGSAVTTSFYQEVVPYVGNTVNAKLAWTMMQGTINTASEYQAPEIINYYNYGFNVLGNTYGSESLTNGALTSGTSWSAANGFSLTSNTAVYVHNASGGTLTQSSADFAVAVKANRWYRFTWTSSALNTTARCYIDPSGISAERVYLRGTVVTPGTYTTTFKTNSNPGDFILTADSAASGDGFTLDDLSLVEVQSGDVIANGKFTGGGTLGLSIDNVGVVTSDADILVPDEAYGAGWNGSLEVPTKNAIYDKLELFAAGTGIDHGGLTGLADDDHTQYAFLAGRASGQILKGGTGVTDVLALVGTSGNGTLTSQAINFNVGNNGATTAMTILNNTFIGIGYTTPGTTSAGGLTLNSTSRGMEIRSTNTSGYPFIFLRRSDGGTGLDLISDSASTGTSFIENRFDTTGVAFNFRARTAGTPVSIIQALGSGRVCIGGNSTPSARLHIDGSAGVTETGNLFQVTNSAGATAFTLDNSTLKARFYSQGNANHAACGYRGAVGIGIASDADTSSLTLIVNSDAKAYVDNSGNFGVGTANTQSARIHAISTTEQLRLGYDTSNYFSTTVGSTGGVTFNAVGTGASFTFSDYIQLAENTSIRLDQTLSADGTYSGTTIAGTAGATLAFGDLVYLSSSDSRWELADADSNTTSGGVMLGMCVLAAASDGDATIILLNGNIRADTAFPTLTIGAPAYVSTTAGDIQVAQPSGTDDVIQVVGFALTADSLYFNPSPDYITHT